MPPSPAHRGPDVATVPPSPAQNATDISGLLQVMDRQRENLDRIATTAQANTDASQANTEAITLLSSDFEKMMYRQNNIEHRQKELAKDQRDDRERQNACQAQQRQTNDEIFARLKKVEMNQATAASAAPAQTTAQAQQSASTPTAEKPPPPPSRRSERLKGATQTPRKGIYSGSGKRRCL